MKVDDIVFAPFKETMWPGRIMTLGVMANIKFYKIKENFTVPANSLVPFNATNIALNLEKNKDKLFGLAVKMAEIQVKKRNNRNTSMEVNLDPMVKVEEGETRALKIEEATQPEMLPIKEEEEGPENINHLPAYNSILDYMLSVDDEELVKLANKGQKHTYTYFNPQKQEKVTHTSFAAFDVIRLV